MRALICSSCGASKWKEDGDYRICEFCGTKFDKTSECNRKVIPSISQTVVRQVKSTIAINEDVARLLQKCRTDPKNARKYANLVLDIDPSNQEAHKYL